jgi:hypothetical protein
MKEERGILQDVIETAQPKEESKAKKYLRIAFAVIFVFAFVVLIIAAAMRKFGS